MSRTLFLHPTFIFPIVPIVACILDFEVIFSSRGDIVDSAKERNTSINNLKGK